VPPLPAALLVFPFLHPAHFLMGQLQLSVRVEISRGMPGISHFGVERTEDYLLVRLEYGEDGEAKAANPGRQ
jgi:hypothetical protein